MKVYTKGTVVAQIDHLIKEWDPTNEEDPCKTTYGSDKKLKWICNTCGHHWRACVYSRTTSERNCPACANLRRRRSRSNDYLANYPELVAEYRGNVPPERLAAGSGQQVKWECANGHQWTAEVKGRIRGRGCGECRRTLPGARSLASKAPDVAKEWDIVTNGGVLPDDVYAGSSIKRAWACSIEPTHKWWATPQDRTRVDGNETGCPVCYTTLQPGESLAEKHPEIALQWHPRLNEKMAKQISTESNEWGWWLCQKCGHEWSRQIQSRSKGIGLCPECWPSGESIIEREMRHKLCEIYQINATAERKIPRTEEGRDWVVDCILPGVGSGKGTVVEYDGNYWHLARFGKDLEKTEDLAAQGWTVVRIRENPLSTIGHHDFMIREGTRKWIEIEEKVCAHIAHTINSVNVH